jgi:hypothetical protein
LTADFCLGLARRARAGSTVRRAADAVLSGPAFRVSTIQIGIAVRVAVGIAVRVAIGIAIGVTIGVAIGVAIGISVRIAVRIAVAVGVAVRIAVTVCVAVGGIEACTHARRADAAGAPG